MRILGIETSCDETSVALVVDGRQVTKELTASSQEQHFKTLGIVPEVAARAQVEYIIPLLDELVGKEGLEFDAIAVTYGPGLIGSLLVGVETAKTLAWSWNKPLFRVNHLLAHFYASFLGKKVSKVPGFPCLFLLVSGGHTDLVVFFDHGRYQYLGGTRDDAAGEAFDKAARLLGLGYPGGPVISQRAEQFSGNLFSAPLPRPLINSKDYDFSFSGLKTALFQKVHEFDTLSPTFVSSLAWEFQNAVVDCLLAKSNEALREFNIKSFVVGGGVSANHLLREKCAESAVKLGVDLFLPEFKYCGDNAAMVSSTAYYIRDLVNPLDLQVEVGLSL